MSRIYPENRVSKDEETDGGRGSIITPYEYNGRSRSVSFSVGAVAVVNEGNHKVEVQIMRSLLLLCTTLAKI